MKQIFFLTLCNIFSIVLFSQNEVHPKWQISINHGIQDADKRLFSFPEIPKKELLNSQSENPKTYQFGLDLTRIFFANNHTSIYVGVGLSTELSTFRRPFNHGFGHDLILGAVFFTNRYYQNLFQLPIYSNFRVLKQFGINLEILPQFNFLTLARHSEGGIEFSWWRFDFYSIEINPGLEWSGKRFNIRMNYRAFQLKLIDRILFSDFTLNDDREDETFETFNPFKLWFSVGYKF